MAPRVLVSDELSETAVQIFRDRGVEVDYMPKLGKDKEKLAELIGQYDGLAIRSATKVTEKLLEGATNLKVQFDCYHCQIVEGDLATTLRRDFDRIGHIQIAGVPDRHEPDQGEVNYPYLFELMDHLGYDGWVGCEYRPKGDTSMGLQWLRDWKAR